MQKKGAKTEEKKEKKKQQLQRNKETKKKKEKKEEDLRWSCAEKGRKKKERKDESGVGGKVGMSVGKVGGTWEKKEIFFFFGVTYS